MRFLVILASYNGEKYIEEQLDSILSQVGVDVNIKAFDDLSSDNTLRVLNKFKDDSRVEVNVNAVGSGSAANNFLNAIKSIDDKVFNEHDFIAFSDQDDIWLENKLESAAKMLQKFQSSLYCSNLTKWNTSDNTFSLLKKDFAQKKFDFLFEGGSAGCTYVFSKKLAIELRQFLFNLDFSKWEEFSHDWLVYFFARSRNYKVIIDSKSYIKYRLHNENVHGHLNQLSINTIKIKTAAVFNGYYENHIINYIKYLKKDSKEYKIYEQFLGSYLDRNFVIWKYNTQLMRDKKKFVIFAVLNLLKFK